MAFVSSCELTRVSTDLTTTAFVEIDYEIISTVILLPSAESFKKGCCQLQAKVYLKPLKTHLIQILFFPIHSNAIPFV